MQICANLLIYVLFLKFKYKNIDFFPQFVYLCNCYFSNSSLSIQFNQHYPDDLPQGEMIRLMAEQQFYGRRLRSARVMKGLSMDELIALMPDVKLSKPAISKYENDKMTPSPEIRMALAATLGVPMDYFFRPLAPENEDLNYDFRKKSSMTATQINALKEKVRDKVERYIEVEQILSDAAVVQNKISLPHRDNVKERAEVIQFATQVRKEWNLSESPIMNIQCELEGHGIKVIPIEENDEFDGLSGTIQNDKVFIVINSSKKHVERRRLTILHELAHQMMSFDASLSGRQVEALCNVFANEMLIPTSAFKKHLDGDNNIDLVSLRPLQFYYGISIDALMKKAEVTGLINTSQYTYYNILKNKNQSFKQAVETSLYTEAPIYDRFLAMVLKAYSLKLIDKDKASSLLHDVAPEKKADLEIL